MNHTAISFHWMEKKYVIVQNIYTYILHVSLMKCIACVLLTVNKIEQNIL